MDPYPCPGDDQQRLSYYLLLSDAIAPSRGKTNRKSNIHRLGVFDLGRAYIATFAPPFKQNFMILTDTQILKAIEKGDIVITPFDRAGLGTNSYDVHLAPYLAVYTDDVLDARLHNQIRHFEIGPDGFVIQPGELYLGVTTEYTETHCAVPFLEGKSSVGRLGIDIHATAGKGDVGYCNTWTLEISCVKPVRIYAGMPIGQLIYFLVEGDIEHTYNKKPNAKYNQRTDRPVESMMWKNKF